MFLPLPRAGARRGVPRAHLHEDWVLLPQTAPQQLEKKIRSQGGDHRERRSEALLLRGTGALPLSSVVSEGAAPLSPSH